MSGFAYYDDSEDEYSDDSDYFDYSGGIKKKDKDCFLKPTDIGRDTGKTITSYIQKPPELQKGYPLSFARQACTSGDVESFKDYISKEYSDGIKGLLERTRDKFLMLACIGGHLELIKYLLNGKNANANFAYTLSLVTPLIAIVTSKQNEDELLSCAAAVIDAGANVNALDNQGRSALMIACKLQKSKLVSYLLSKEADPNLVDPNGRTALFHAASSGNGYICRLLLEGKANMNIIDNGGWKVSDFAQHIRMARLAEALYNVEVETSLKERNSETSVWTELEMVKDEADPLTQPNSEIQLILSAAKGENYFNTFVKQGITFQKLLTFTDADLKEMGVDHIGTRMHMNEIIKLVHTTDWERASLRRVEKSRRCTAAELRCMICIINSHMQKIVGTLTYIKLEHDRNPIDPSTDNGKQKIKDIRARLKKLFRICSLLKAHSNRLYNALKMIQENDPTFQVKGLVAQEKLCSVEKKSVNSYYLWGSCGLALLAILNLGCKWIKSC